MPWKADGKDTTPQKVMAEDCFASPKKGRSVSLLFSSPMRDTGKENVQPPHSMSLVPRTPMKTPSRLPTVQEQQEQNGSLPDVDKLDFMPAYLAEEEQGLEQEGQELPSGSTPDFRHLPVPAVMVKNTFIQFESPQRTRGTASPPKSVPPFFAPNSLHFSTCSPSLKSPCPWSRGEEIPRFPSAEPVTEAPAAPAAPAAPPAQRSAATVVKLFEFLEGPPPLPPKEPSSSEGSELQGLSLAMSNMMSWTTNADQQFKLFPPEMPTGAGFGYTMPGGSYQMAGATDFCWGQPQMQSDMPWLQQALQTNFGALQYQMPQHPPQMPPMQQLPQMQQMPQMPQVGQVGQMPQMPPMPQTWECQMQVQQQQHQQQQQQQQLLLMHQQLQQQQLQQQQLQPAPVSPPMDQLMQQFMMQPNQHQHPLPPPSGDASMAPAPPPPAEAPPIMYPASPVIADAPPGNPCVPVAPARQRISISAELFPDS